MFIPRKSIKAQNFGDGAPSPRSGNCKYCGEWESELSKDGYCPDEDCKRSRQLTAFASGKAMIYYEDGNGKYRLFKSNKE